MNSMSDLMITSGFSFDGYEIVKYLDYISCDEVIRFPVTDVTNTRDNYAHNLTGPIDRTRRNALNKLKSKALTMGCNALIGVSYDYYNFDKLALDRGISTQQYFFICVTANGTAVKVEKRHEITETPAKKNEDETNTVVELGDVNTEPEETEYDGINPKGKKAFYPIPIEGSSSVMCPKCKTVQPRGRHLCMSCDLPFMF